MQTAESVARDWLSLALIGLGITFPPGSYLGGLFLALAGASLATTLDSESRRLGIFGTLAAAFFISHMMVIVSQHFMPSLSPQMVMAVSGFASRYIARVCLRVLQRVETRSDAIGDHLVSRFVPPHLPPAAPPTPPVDEETRP